MHAGFSESEVLFGSTKFDFMKLVKMVLGSLNFI